VKFFSNLIKKCTPKFLLIKMYSFRALFRYLAIRREFKGTNVYCPCCDKHFSDFKVFKYDTTGLHNIDFYKNTSLNVVCPFCGSYPRHRIVCDYLKKENILLPTSNILIFAMPLSYKKWFKRNNLRYISADLFNIRADMKTDIQNISFDDNYFDFISCDHVLEHVPDYIAALKELKRVVKTGGVCGNNGSTPSGIKNNIRRCYNYRP